jgi:hypothetical protein
VSDRVAQHAEVHRLSDHDVEACIERAAAVLGSHMAGAGDGGGPPPRPFAAAHAAYQLVAVFDRHADI